MIIKRAVFPLSPLNFFITNVGYQDSILQTATSELLILLECFANGQSMIIIFDAVNKLMDDTKNDGELRDSKSCLKFKLELWGYIRKATVPALVVKVRFSVSI